MGRSGNLKSQMGKNETFKYGNSMDMLWDYNPFSAVQGNKRNLSVDLDPAVDEQFALEAMAHVVRC